MLKINCPKCGETIELGKDAYNALLNEIEKDEIEKRVSERVNTLEKNYKLKLELDVRKALDNKQEELNKKEDELKKLKDHYEFELEAKEAEVKKWKDFRMGDSTKDLGESLEKYCHEAFDEVRAVAYPDAYFEKDNHSDEEGKGDFIFRDFQDGVETVSIMFEMKNEKDTTKTKNKNEHFFEKLDKNRTSKGCEYAVLVSTLEEDSGLYNKGIVDVSHRYPKMFVVRPQFFLTIIGLIRNMARNTLAYKKQVVEYKKQNLDITKFEDAVKAVTDKINTDYDRAGAIYSDVEEMCDAMIKKINDFKDKFKTAAGWIGKAKNQIPHLDVKELTKNNDTMREKFDALNRSKELEGVDVND